MTTYSPAAFSPRFGHLHTHLRTYVAAVGATAALTAGTLVAFLSLATFVAFKGLPFGGSGNDAGSAYLESSLSAAPTAAGVALGAAAAAVADHPVAGSAGAGASPRTAAAGADGSGGSGSGGADASGKARSGGGPSDPGTSSPPGDAPSPPIAVPTLPSTSGPTNTVVQGIDTAAGTNLSGPTRGVTRPVDRAGAGALNRAGGAAGRSSLDTQAGSAVGGITGSGLGG